MGGLLIGKGLTTRHRVFEGIEAGLASVAEQLDLSVRTLLERATLLIYATTTATNAILEGKTARTAFLVTEGFPDILVLREGGKASAYDFTQDYPEPYIPRRLTFQICERIDSEGNIRVPLDERHAVSVIERLRRLRVEAVAVCFLWSIVDPVHEKTVGRLLDEHLPGIPYTLSHELNPIIREYRRASSTALDASLKPLMQRHLSEMQEDLRRAGFRGELLAATSLGGVVQLDRLADQPILATRSGPSLAPVAARHYAHVAGDARDLIVCDAGGTSFDVSLVRDGLIKTTRETWLGKQYTGHITGMSSVDARSVGAGGGSIAWIDGGGLLRVGPQSAGSDPGPACYGRGGTVPTVTDAALVLGYLDPDYFLGGRMKLDRAAARRVIDTLASSLGTDAHGAASAILTVASEEMVRAIREITINEGVDPRDGLIVAGGGAAGLNIVPIARELGCRQVLIPRTAGALSACGAQYSDIVAEFTAATFAVTSDFPFDAVNASLRSIRSAMDDFMAGLQLTGLRGTEHEFFVEARYPRQVWELDVALPKGSFDGPGDVRELERRFHAAHERVFTVKQEAQPVACVLWRGRVRGILAAPVAQVGPASTPGRASLRRRAYFAPAGEREVAVVRGAGLAQGSVVAGPAIIEEPTTTIVAYPGSSLEVTSDGSYLITVA